MIEARTEKEHYKAIDGLRAMSCLAIIAMHIYFFGETFVVSDFAPRHSIIYCIPMFIMGGILYIYCDEIHRFCSKYYMPALLLCILVTGIYYLTPFNAGGTILFFIRQ